MRGKRKGGFKYETINIELSFLHASWQNVELISRLNNIRFQKRAKMGVKCVFEDMIANVAIQVGSLGGSNE